MRTMDRIPDEIAAGPGIREHFPALLRHHRGRPVAYFDGPGGTQVPTQVVEAMSDYLLHHNANTHWAYPSSLETDEIISAGRLAMADLLNASPDEIAFGANMTTLTFHLARALGRGWGEGDEIVLTELDHHANVAPWQAIARERGVSLHMASLNPETGTLDWDDLERKLGRRTRLLAIGAASNALGTITDVARATALAHAAGALVFVDAVHYAPHALTDVQAIDCDFLACSAYKFYGPHIGALFGRADLLRALDVPKLEPAPDDAPERMETGTQNHEGIAGATAAIDFIAGLASIGTAGGAAEASGRDGRSRRARLAAAYDVLHRQGDVLLRRLWSGLAAIPGVRLHGPDPDQPRTPTVAFTVDDLPARLVAERLADEAVFVSHGDFYATGVVRRLGLQRDGLVRAGCSCYTTPDEIDRLVLAVRDLVRGST